MYIDFLLDAFRAQSSEDALVWRERVVPYSWLLDAVLRWKDDLGQDGVTPGSVVSLEADFSPSAVALLLALVEHGCTIVPLTSAVEQKKEEFREIAQVEASIEIDSDDDIQVSPTALYANHPLLRRLKNERRPGLILFSSGSTGKNKAALHDLVPLLEKFKVPRHTFRTLTFLLFDHIGGINTLFYTLSNAGCIVTVQDRSPDVVCAAVEKYKVQLLPTSPTFINLLLLSEAYKRYDLSSLRMVTYGTEVMPERTLKRFHELFPQIQLTQTYGLSELGILRSKSKSPDSLWVKIGGEGFETRVVNGMLEIKARSAMLGYLNEPSPFTKDGWFQTGDAVEVDGEYFRILGRKSEIINVGGEKVYPAEVESVLLSMNGVEDVTVGGERHPLTGHIVKAKVRLSTGETLADFRKRMRAFCQDKLPTYKVPQKVILASEPLHSERYKKLRAE